MLPDFPLYIVSKGRHDSRLTSKTLELMGVPYFIVVEAQEFPAYAAVIDRAKILVLDKAYQRDYDLCTAADPTGSTGPGPARNFVWDHAIASGAAWHWVMDDNINGFYRLNKNQKIRAGDGAIFKCMENFVLRYSNIAMAGPNYLMFVPRKYKFPPFTTNNRIYSCNLIKGNTGFRWRGRYNEDTDLSLRMLKTGWCTVQFNAFLQNKVATQSLKGGNTDAFYAKEGTWKKSQMQIKLHPDVSKMVRKYGRWHHHVDYSGFKANKLILRDGVTIPAGVDDFGMNLRQVAG